MNTENVNLWGETQEQDTETAVVAEELNEEIIPAEESTEESDEESAEDSSETTETPKQGKLSAYEQAILSEMERRAQGGDSLLAEALKNVGKTIQSCFAYVKEQARKQATAGCAMIEDSVVYGWAHHYYIESQETIDAEMKKTKSAPKEKTEEEKKAEENKKKVFENPLLASLMKKGAKIAEGEVAVTKTTTKKDDEGNVLSSKSVKTDADGTRTTTIEKEGKTYTMTEFALF